MEPICAPATPLLSSSVTIIRVSGDNLGNLFEPLIKLPDPRNATLCSLKWKGYHEKALVIFFPSPNSYTGEDVVEFHLHGNPLLVRRFLEHLGDLGVRLAVPGEFTKRALFNGKQGLLDVEALKDLMTAATDAQIRQAQARVGRLPDWIINAKEEISQLVAQTEASVDYGEDEGIALHINKLKTSAKKLKDTFHVEQRRSTVAGWLRDGIRVAIIGRPNAGKSTLFNVLAGEERAIVTEIPGTTRDVLEAKCELAGLPLHLFDTAGIRATDDPIESLGVARIDPLLQMADLVLHLVPATDHQPDPETQAFIEPYPEKTILVRNQCDLAQCSGICISAKTGDLAQLEIALKQRFCGEFSPDACLGALATERQRDLLSDMVCQMELIAELPENVPPEIPASLLQGAWGLLTRLTGEDRADLALDAMFSGFCLGK
ncbi:MAG: tRNA uridine-5-carboxymethylaminomethyl(34) synthesis GTPase MnmE [Holophagaceae bacterium]|nr:tRNA uridine-5-carboxymethylaminomethyl(34) synthesis GTPase MnmE [Holophagaceae bacterium]